MNNEKYIKLNEMICELIIQLEKVIKNNKLIDHEKRYSSLLEYLNYYKEKTCNLDKFDFEIVDFGLGLYHFLEESVDSKEFYMSVCNVDKYFFNEFVLAQFK